MLFSVPADRVGGFAINEFSTMNAAQWKHLWHLLFSLPPLLSSAGSMVSWTCVDGVRAALQPTQLQFGSAQYLITTDVKRLLCSLRKMLLTKGWYDSYTSSAMLMIIKQNMEFIQTNGLSLLPKDKQRLFLCRHRQGLKRTPCKWFDMTIWIRTRAISSHLSL